MMYHVVNVLKEITRHTITLKIPFYLINVTQWRVESWFTNNNELIIKMVRKDELG
jgi:hypothetical protein